MSMAVLAPLLWCFTGQHFTHFWCSRVSLATISLTTSVPIMRGARRPRPYTHISNSYCDFLVAPSLSFTHIYKARGSSRPPWLARWLADWLAGWLAGWPVGWLRGCLAAWLVGWLARWLVGWLAGWLTKVGAGGQEGGRGKKARGRAQGGKGKEERREKEKPYIKKNRESKLPIARRPLC